MTFFRHLPVVVAATIAATIVTTHAHPHQRSHGNNEGYEITVLHTNDMHGRHMPFQVAPGDATSQTGDLGRAFTEFPRPGTVGGLARIATAIKQTREEVGSQRVLLFEAGDVFSDDFVLNKYEGKPMIQLMNSLGYDYMSLGNHDFDYGLERTRELQAMATFPMRGANVLEKGVPIFGQPWKVFDMLDGQIKVAVLAMGYHNTHQTGSRDNTEGLDFQSGIEIARHYIPMLRQKADVVILLSHQGTTVDRRFAAEVAGVDLIIGGHSHDMIAPSDGRVNDTWIVQALSDGAMMGRLRIQLDGRKKLRAINGEVLKLYGDQWAPDPETAAAVSRWDHPFASKRDEMLATSYDRIGRQYKSESPFDVLVCNIMRNATGADVAFMPGVGYGVSIEPGPVTRDRLYTLLPHPTKLVTLLMTGDQILDVLEQSAINLEPADDMDRVGGLVQTAGIGWSADLNQPTGSRVSNVTIGADINIPTDRETLDKDLFYKVATNVGMLGGLHRYTAFAKGTEIVIHDQSITNLVETSMKEQKYIVIPATGFVRIVYRIE